jgi:quinol monooxygenase YgiN
MNAKRQPGETPEAQVLVVVSLASVRGVRLLPEFIRLSQRCVQQAETSPGNLGTAIRVRSPLTWCTLTRWIHEKTMLQFVQSDAYREALRRTDQLVTATKFARLTTSAAIDNDLWQQAFAVLDQRNTE